MDINGLEISHQSTVDFRGHRAELGRLFLAVAAGTAVVSALTFPQVLGPDFVYLKKGLGEIILVACGLMLLVTAARFLRAGTPVITVGPSGFLDRRTLKAPIPWQDIAELDRVRIRRNEYVRLFLQGSSAEGPKVRIGTRLIQLGGNELAKNEFAFNAVGVQATQKQLVAQILVTAAMNGHTIRIRGNSEHAPGTLAGRPRGGAAA